MGYAWPVEFWNAAPWAPKNIFVSSPEDRLLLMVSKLVLYLTYLAIYLDLVDFLVFLLANKLGIMTFFFYDLSNSTVHTLVVTRNNINKSLALAGRPWPWAIALSSSFCCTDGTMMKPRQTTHQSSVRQMSGPWRLGRKRMPLNSRLILDQKDVFLHRIIGLGLFNNISSGRSCYVCVYILVLVDS